MNVVALHALNPWGFSHRSITDEANIDLNRNFTDYDQPLAQDELYPILFRAICPDDWTEETIDWTQVRDERSEEHTSELQSLMRISYAVFCLKKKTRQLQVHHINQ